MKKINKKKKDAVFDRQKKEADLKGVEMKREIEPHEILSGWLSDFVKPKSVTRSVIEDVLPPGVVSSAQSSNLFFSGSDKPSRELQDLVQKYLNVFANSLEEIVYNEIRTPSPQDKEKLDTIKAAISIEFVSTLLSFYQDILDDQLKNS